MDDMEEFPKVAKLLSLPSLCTVLCLFTPNVLRMADHVNKKPRKNQLQTFDSFRERPNSVLDDSRRTAELSTNASASLHQTPVHHQYLCLRQIKMFCFTARTTGKTAKSSWIMITMAPNSWTFVQTSQAQYCAILWTLLLMLHLPRPKSIYFLPRSFRLMMPI